MSFERYRAQLFLPGWQQEKIQRASVLVVGAGALGNAASLYLAAMGVGHIGLADPDTIELSNLHRQPLFSPSQVGQLKVEVVGAYLKHIRPDLRLTLYPQWMDQAQLVEILSLYDIVIDATDNFSSRYAIDAACEQKKAWVYGAIYRWEGQVGIFERARYRELFPSVDMESLDCSSAGVVGALPGVIGSWQALLAVQHLQNPSWAPTDTVWVLNFETGHMTSLVLRKPSRPKIALTWQEAQARKAQWIYIGDQPPPFPMYELPWEKIDSFTPPEGEVIVVCPRGVQSQWAARLWQEKFQRQDIFYVLGGIPNKN
ncbi:MAG: HesA/MoeB/ThiF family protein [Bacteroidia bacterium]